MAIKVFQPVFFARLDTRTPFNFSVVMVVVNIAASLILFPLLKPYGLGHFGIAVATALSAWVNLALLAFTAWNRGQFRPDGTTLRRIAMICLSSILMGIVVWWLNGWLGDGNSGFADKLADASLVVGAGVAVYAVAAIATGGIDRTVFKMLRR